MNEARIAKLQNDADKYDHADTKECLLYIGKLRSKLAITKDGFAVGLGESVYHPEPDGTVKCLEVLGSGSGRVFKAYDNGPRFDVSECYASLTTALEVAEDMKKEDSDDT